MQGLQHYVDELLRMNNIDLSKLDVVSTLSDGSIVSSTKLVRNEIIPKSTNRNPFQNGFLGKKPKDIYLLVKDTVDQVLSYTFPINLKHIPGSIFCVGDQFIEFREGRLVIGIDVFNLTLSHEVMRSNETLYSLHTKIIDSCIDIIVSRPVLREHPLVHKFPHTSMRQRALNPI